jgi:hypothetical protein
MGVRTSRNITPMFREVYFTCREVFCGASFKASLNIDAEISPSAAPNPKVDLPRVPVIWRRDKPPAPANDDAEDVAATA